MEVLFPQPHYTFVTWAADPGDHQELSQVLVFGFKTFILWIMRALAIVQPLSPALPHNTKMVLNLVFLGCIFIYRINK
jgi:hypothetical protein